MKPFISFLILALLVLSCNAQKDLPFAHFNSETAQNSFKKITVLPGLPSGKKYTEYQVSLDPSVSHDYEIQDANGNTIPSFTTILEKNPEAAIIKFSDQNISFEEEDLVLLVLKKNDTPKRVLLPLPTDGGTMAMP